MSIRDARNNPAGEGTERKVCASGSRLISGAGDGRLATARVVVVVVVVEERLRKESAGGGNRWPS